MEWIRGRKSEEFLCFTFSPPSITVSNGIKNNYKHQQYFCVLMSAGEMEFTAASPARTVVSVLCFNPVVSCALRPQHTTGAYGGAAAAHAEVGSRPEGRQDGRGQQEAPVFRGVGADLEHEGGSVPRVLLAEIRGAEFTVNLWCKEKRFM